MRFRASTLRGHNLFSDPIHPHLKEIQNGFHGMIEVDGRAIGIVPKLIAKGIAVRPDTGLELI